MLIFVASLRLSLHQATQLCVLHHLLFAHGNCRVGSSACIIIRTRFFCGIKAPHYRTPSQVKLYIKFLLLFPERATAFPSFSLSREMHYHLQYIMDFNLTSVNGASVYDSVVENL